MLWVPQDGLPVDSAQMKFASKKIRFWIPIVILLVIAAYVGLMLVKAHFVLDVARLPNYDFSEEIPSIRGGFYCYSSGGTPYPLVKSTPCWEYRLDPVAMTQSVVKAKSQKQPRTRKAQAVTIADVLGLPREKVFSMIENFSNRYQLLKVSDDRRAYEILSDRTKVAGVVINNTNERRYFEGNRLCHVLGGVNKQNEGVEGLEAKYNRYLKGTPGRISGKKDGLRRVITDKIEEKIPPIPGCDIYLTIDHFLQKTVEEELTAGIAEFGAAAGWSVVLDVATGRVLAMASYPDYDPRKYSTAKSEERRNRVVGYNYEPGSVMKVITAAAAVDAGFASAHTVFSTDRGEKDRSGKYKYYSLPRDSHAMDEKLTLKDAIVHSSNVAIGKLGYDFGPKRVYEYLRKFGFGRKSGIEVPGEQYGLLNHYSKWDKASWSRIPIGQGVAVSAIQLASAYQAIANDGVRLPPYIVDSIRDADGNDLLMRKNDAGERVISLSAARQVREMMLGVAAAGGTARRARLKGYSVAGKTGTAQKAIEGQRGYAPGLYRATFCGIVPSGVVKRNPEDSIPVPPEIVVLVTLDFDQRATYHQGGNSAGPIFKRITERAMRYLEIAPDKPEEIADEED